MCIIFFFFGRRKRIEKPQTHVLRGIEHWLKTHRTARMHPTNNEHQFCRPFRLWFLVWCCVHVALSLCFALGLVFNLFISNAWNNIDKRDQTEEKKSTTTTIWFGKFCSTLYYLHSAFQYHWINRRTRSIEPRIEPVLTVAFITYISYMQWINTDVELVSC